MAELERSALEFKSNIYPVFAEQILCDEEFLHALRDPLAIKEFEKRAYRYFPTQLQKEIRQRGIGTKCSFSPEGDLCWGTIRDDDGEIRVVCRCENRQCQYFHECRPDQFIAENAELEVGLPQVGTETEPTCSIEETAPCEPPAFEEIELEQTDAPYVTWAYDKSELRLTVIGNGAVKKSSEWASLNIREVVISDGIFAIEDGAFAGFGEISRVKLPPTLKVLGARAFDECLNIAEMDLPDGLRVIGDNAFRCCEALEAIKIPSALEKIGRGAFMGCEAMVDADLSMATLMRLEDGLFDGCIALEEIFIPDTVEVIGEEAFNGCLSLKKIAFAESSILEEIGHCAFYGCEALQKVDMPSSISVVGESAFEGCSVLKIVTFTGELPDFGCNVFEGCSCQVIYPSDDPTWDNKSARYRNRRISWVEYPPHQQDLADGGADEVSPEAKLVEKREPSRDAIESLAGESDDAWLNAKSESEPGHQGLEGRYDDEQAKVVCADPATRMYVNAGPGAGKTHTLIEKLKHMIEEQELDPNRITVISFTRAAVSVIKGRLKDSAERGEIHAMRQDIDITTIDKLCTRLLFFDADGDKAAEKKISGLSYDARIVKAQRLLEEKPELLEDCDHVIIDETQDLVGARADFVIALLRNLPNRCGFTLLGDRCQAIYGYQVKDGDTTSERFFTEISEALAPEQLHLEKNYRQKSSYPLNLAEMRQALLAQNADAASALIAKHGLALGMPSEALRKIDKGAIDRLRLAGSLGILTRSNDEALAVESVLWKIGVPSAQGRSDAGDMLTRCIADAFIACDGETTSKSEFEGATAAHDQYKDGRIWKALIGLDGLHLNGDRLRIESALSALNGAALPAELTAAREESGAVTVSTVHAAKGREFDNVWMLAEDLAQFASENELEEKRVAYVGLSRGATGIALQCLDEHFLIGGKSTFYSKRNKYIDRICRKRSGGRARNGKTKLVNIEIKNEKDIDCESFRSFGRAQELLRSGGVEGEPIRLVLKGSGDTARYEIVLQNDESVVLGKMTRDFCDDYKICADYYNRDSIALPDAFDELYIDRITTCIGRSVSDVTYDRSFGDMAVWYGIALGGYAHRDDSQGY